MKAHKFINKYLKYTEDLIVEVHDPTNTSSILFSIHEWNNVIDVTKEEQSWFGLQVSQIWANIKTYENALRIVIHIYTDSNEEEVDK